MNTNFISGGPQKMKKKINGNCLELPDFAKKFINKKFEKSLPLPPDMIKLNTGREMLEYVLYTFLLQGEFSLATSMIP